MNLSWLRIRTVVRRNFVVLWRSPHRWFDLTVWPLVDVVVWGALGSFVAQENDTSRAGTPYLLAGIMLFHVLYQSQIAVTTGFMEETWTRNLLNIMTTPLREVEYAIGLALYGLAKLALGMTAVVLTALVFFGFNLAEVGWSLAPIALVLLIAAWAGSQFVIGLMLRYGQSAEILAWGVLFVIMALSGVFNPVESIPGPLQPIARVLPTTHAFAAARSVLDGEALPWGDIGAGLAGAAVAAAAGLTYVVRMLAVFRRRGSITRFNLNVRPIVDLVATEDDVRQIALSLPETIEKPWFGTPGFRVKDKGFLRIRSEAEGGLVVWVSDLGEKEALLASEPEKFFTTPHYDGHPTVLVNLPAVGVDELRELITESWLIRAPKRVRQAHEDEVVGDA